jgi:excisionase family DNA binding protein
MSTTIQGVTFYTVQEAAQALDVTPQTVRAYIKDGKLKSKRIGRPILITEKDLRQFVTK